MNRLLEQAIAEVSKLPQDDQEAIAALIMEELASEERWEKLFAESQDVLASLADQALAEHGEGRTKELDPDAL